MKIRTLRWGYDGGGVACGPVEGSTIVEIGVTNNEGHNMWICVTRMSEFERAFVSPMPLFDILIQSNHYDVDWEPEFEKVTKTAVEDYDYEIYEPAEDIKKSEYVKAINLARFAMQEYYGSDDEETDYITAKKFFEKYEDEEIDGINIPEVIYEFDDDECDEDEE